MGDGLFLECCKEVASGYPEITLDSMIVDNTAMQVCVSCGCFFFLTLCNLDLQVHTATYWTGVVKLPIYRVEQNTIE